MKLITAEQMQNADRKAIEQFGIPGAVLMENAGRAATDLLCREFSELFPGPVLILAGKGNNGGDGYVMARTLLELGWQVRTLVLAAADSVSGDAALMLEILQRLDGNISFAENVDTLSHVFSETKPRLLIDALLGTGLASAVRGLYAEAIELINDSGLPVLAVDIPSGVDGSNGRIHGSAVSAEITVSFDQGKVGHGSYPGASKVGRLKVVKIGIPPVCHSTDTPECRLLDAADATKLLPARFSGGHKGSFGHLLVVAGSSGKTGAATLAGDAAVRSGCGLVTVACPASVHDILELKLTEAMTAPLPEVGGLLAESCWPELQKLLAGRDALAVGPGLGRGGELERLIRRMLIECPLPVVADADALNAFAGHAAALFERESGSTVLTPHPGEMARLTGLSVTEIEADRFNIAREFAGEFGVVLVLKGPRTVIAAPDGRVNINASGNVGLASGGSGDVLTGLIGGLLAQGMGAFESASLGCFLHGMAADRLAADQGCVGLKASDLLSQIPLARNQLTQGDLDA
ncbi:MAG TPA: NAD(P)H-hydrate dehydratase [Geopsychrobacteraceae bacterium]|nr:NAD(P)H-hydrate dehydratase [Geopsychrobacteraceae bacterium]